MLNKNQNFVGMLQTTEGYRPHEMYVVPMDDMKEANSVSSSYAGFKIVYGRTEDNQVMEFIKAGKWAKRDFDRMKDLGIIELICSGCFAPKNFTIYGKWVQVSRSFECGKETKERFDRYAKALGMM